jgi:hypothetical protein
MQSPTRLLVREGKTPFDVKSVPVCLFRSSSSKPLLQTSPPFIIDNFFTGRIDVDQRSVVATVSIIMLVAIFLWRSGHSSDANQCPLSGVKRTLARFSVASRALPCGMPGESAPFAPRSPSTGAMAACGDRHQEPKFPCDRLTTDARRNTRAAELCPYYESNPCPARGTPCPARGTQVLILFLILT